jgi:hypothetical protein
MRGPQPFRSVVMLMVLAGFIAVTGCVSLQKEGTLPAQQALKGKTKQDLLACAGKPASETKMGPASLLVYSRQACCLERSFPTAKGSQVASPPHGCRAVVRLEDDHVVEVQYHNVPPDVAAQDHCEEIFASCLR